MSKLTIQEIDEKRTLLGQITLSGDADQKVNIASDKLNYAIAKLKKRFDSATKPLTDNFNKSVVEPFNEAMEDLRIRYASVYPEDFEAKEKRGQLIVDESGQRAFTQENTLAFNTEVKPLAAAYKDASECFAKTEVTLPGEPYFADENWPRVNEVSLFIKEELAGLLFKYPVSIVGGDEYGVEQKIRPVAMPVRNANEFTDLQGSAIEVPKSEEINN